MRNFVVRLRERRRIGEEKTERESHDPRCWRVRNSEAPEKRVSGLFLREQNRPATWCTAIFRHV